MKPKINTDGGIWGCDDCNPATNGVAARKELVSLIEASLDRTFEMKPIMELLEKYEGAHGDFMFNAGRVGGLRDGRREIKNELRTLINGD
jgi:hypothetical protein